MIGPPARSKSNDFLLSPVMRGSNDVPFTCSVHLLPCFKPGGGAVWIQVWYFIFVYFTLSMRGSDEICFSRLQPVIDRTRDVKEDVRTEAFMQLASRAHIQVSQLLGKRISTMNCDFRHFQYPKEFFSWNTDWKIDHLKSKELAYTCSVINGWAFPCFFGELISETMKMGVRTDMWIWTATSKERKPYRSTRGFTSWR